MPRLRYRMAVGRLAAVVGRDPPEEALELELDVGEAVRMLWAARCGVLSGLVDDI